MRPIVFIVPGPLETLTGGSIYDRRMVAGLRARGWTVDVRELDVSFPRPTAAALGHAAAVLGAIPAETLVVIDGLAFGAMPDLAARTAARLRIIALVHLPLAEAVGIDSDAARQFEADERRSLASARWVVVTGRTTIASLGRYGVAPDRVALVEPGTDPAPIARGSGGGPPRLLCVGNVTPGKGHPILIRALAANRSLEWTLTCVGDLRRYPKVVDSVRTAARMGGIEERVTFAGELEGDALHARYDAADLFVLATRRETFGMAVAEALARGLPVIGTTTGAIPTLVGEEAGLLVPPGDADALTSALSRVLDDAKLRGQLRTGALRARNRLESWDAAVGRMTAVLERVATDD